MTLPREGKFTSSHFFASKDVVGRQGSVSGVTLPFSKNPFLQLLIFTEKARKERSGYCRQALNDRHENQKGTAGRGREKMSRRFATNITTIYDMSRQFATFYDNFRLFIPLT